MKRGFFSFAFLSAAALALSGCVIEVPPADVIVTDPPPVTVTITPGEDDEVAEEPQAPVEWTRFNDDRIPHTFEVPSNWTVQSGGDNASVDLYLFEIYNEDEELALQYYSWLYDAALGCGDSPVQMEVVDLASEPVPLRAGDDAAASPLRFVYRVSSAPGYPYLGSLAITVGNDYVGGSCAYDNIAGDPGPGVFADVLRVNIINREEGQHEFDTFEEAEAFMQTEEYETLKRVLTSLRLK